MTAMSDYLENRLADHLFRATAFAAPTALWIALGTNGTTLTDSSSFTEVSTSGTGYARKQWNPSSSANWRNTQGTVSGASTGTSGTVVNDAAITFNAPVGSGWGSVTCFAIFDSDAGGSNNMHWYGMLTASKTVNAGDAAPSFQAGQLSIQIDNG
jgi:hypothetical protein